MKIETAWYELSPYIFVGSGIAANIYSPGSLLLRVSGLLLLAVAITILGLRWIYRRELTKSGGVPFSQKKLDKLLYQDLFYEIDKSL
ncbi:MAG: hypothetical protein ACR2GP_07070 [Burkholderiaceae bacterium]